MFAIDTWKKGSEQLLSDWFIIVNGQKCKCNRSIAEEISPIIKSYYKEKRNENSMFETEISDLQSLSDSELNLGNPLNAMCIMISRIFSGEEIICQKDNISLLLLIGNHFKVQEIISTIEDYLKYMETISSHLNDGQYFKRIVKLEKILLFEMNETNVESKVLEYKSLIKEITANCFIRFVIKICLKNYKIVDINGFIIEIITSVDKIFGGTLSLFKSIIFQKFVILNSNFYNDKDMVFKKEINSLFHQMLMAGLFKNFDENIKFNKYDLTIPQKLKKFFEDKGIFHKLSKEITAQNREIMNQLDPFIDYLKNDDVNSFHNYIVSSSFDINCMIKNNYIKRISIIDNDKGCSLIELSAFLGALQCFKYLNNQQAKINKSKLSEFAIAGGNSEIIHICERAECLFNDLTLDISIEYHRHKITKWLVDTQKLIISEMNFRNCITYNNMKVLKYLIKKGIDINKMLIYICESNNIILFKWLIILLKNHKVKLMHQDNNKTALHIACEQNNVEIVNLLLSECNIDINSIYKVQI